MEIIYSGNTGVNVSMHTLNSYSIHSTKTPKSFNVSLDFQIGPLIDGIPNGATNESVLATVLHRLTAQNDAYPCEENEIALSCLREVLRQLDLRQERITQERLDDSN